MMMLLLMGQLRLSKHTQQNTRNSFFLYTRTENQYQKGNKRITATLIYLRAKGKYIAICEGDELLDRSF